MTSCEKKSKAVENPKACRRAKPSQLGEGHDDFDSYRDAYFTHPAPEARFRFRSAFGATLYLKTSLS